MAQPPAKRAVLAIDDILSSLDMSGSGSQPAAADTASASPAKAGPPLPPRRMMGGVPSPAKAPAPAAAAPAKAAAPPLPMSAPPPLPSSAPPPMPGSQPPLARVQTSGAPAAFPAGAAPATIHHQPMPVVAAAPFAFQPQPVAADSFAGGTKHAHAPLARIPSLQVVQDASASPSSFGAGAGAGAGAAAAPAGFVTIPLSGTPVSAAGTPVGVGAGAGSAAAPLASLSTFGSGGFAALAPLSEGKAAPLSSSSVAAGAAKGALPTWTFGKSMTHNFDVVTQQVAAGIYASKRVASCFKKICALEEEFAKGIMKVLQHETTKVQRLSHDHARLYEQAWAGTKDNLAQLASFHSQQSAKIMFEVVVPLLEFHGSAEERRKQLMMEERKASAEMASARTAVVTGLTNCQKLIATAQTSKDNQKKAATEQKSSSLLSKISDKVKAATNQTPEALQAKALVSAQQYTAAINAANICQKSYLEEKLPRIFDEMQQMETTRLDHVRSALVKHGEIRRQFVAPMNEIAKQFVNVANPMDSQKDIQGCIQSWLAEYGQPQADLPFEYKLPCSLEDIKRGQLEGNPNSVFAATLPHCMTLQKSTHPTLDVPRILPMLIDAVKQQGGFQTEGIFRVSAAKTAVDELQAQLEKGNYDVKFSSPHEPSNLLKQWLRQLAEPVIPETLYPLAINAAKDKQCAPSVITGLYGQLEPLNRRVIDRLAAMAREISSGQNGEATKMTIDNLAIVFAPGLMRNPSQDPIEVLQNTKFESRFIALLFTHAPG